MNSKEIELISRQAGELMDADYHCSEALLLAVGSHYLGEIPSGLIHLSTPFAGGVGSTHLELCGALTGGLMVIGGLYGRDDAQTNDDHCQTQAAALRAEFLRTFGWLKCQDLKDHWIGIAGQSSCRALVEKAAGVLVDLIENEITASGYTNS